MSENCLFCLEPVGPKDLAVTNLPCMCRTPQHDACREKWNQLNPYRCPICRKTFKPDVRHQAPPQTRPHATAPPLDSRSGPDPMFMNPVADISYQNSAVYVAMPPAQPESQPVIQTGQTSSLRQGTSNSEQVKKAFLVCSVILIGALLILLAKAMFG